MPDVVEWDHEVPEIRDPHDGETIRCNPDPASSFPAWVVRDPNKPGQYYVVARSFLAEFEAKLPGRAKPAILHMCMNTEGAVFFWPIETEGDTAS